jgi:hypothetical protein
VLSPGQHVGAITVEALHFLFPERDEGKAFDELRPNGVREMSNG